MKEKVYNLELDLSWKVLRAISKIDRFDASWSSIEKIEGKSLKQLKSVATIQSVGASTRIEGSKLTDTEVEDLISSIDISKIEDRDSQEVVGYFNVLDLISDSFDEIEIKESNIKNLHKLLLKFSKKDDWHKGDYKQHSNAVQATFPDGTKQHPFQDGNGRLSRLLTTMLLLKSGYKWIEYVSFEHEIENNKKAYYRVLRNCQAQRPNEDITEWIDFFLDSLINLQNKLDSKLEENGLESKLSPKEKEVLTFIGNNVGVKSGVISKELGISKPTIKRIISILLEQGLIQKHGKGAGTNYSIK